MRPPIIPESELQLSYSRSGGPGGQNVNRRETRVQLVFDYTRSTLLSAEQKAVLSHHPAVRHLLTEAGTIQIAVDTHRSQRMNIEAGIERLNALIARVLTPQKKRRPTKATRGSKERRLDAKKRRSQTKAARRHRED